MGRCVASAAEEGGDQQNKCWGRFEIISGENKKVWEKLFEEDVWKHLGVRERWENYVVGRRIVKDQS